MKRHNSSTREPERTRGPLTRCDYHDPATGEVCDAVASYGFSLRGYSGVTPHHLEKNTCTAHRAWGKAYWESING